MTSDKSDQKLKDSAPENENLKQDVKSEEVKEEAKTEPKTEPETVSEKKVEPKVEQQPKTNDTATPKPAPTLPQEPKKEEPKPEPSGKFKDIILQIEKLSVLELSELVKELESRFGVSAAAPMAVASGASGEAKADEEAEKANFTLVLADAGDQKINVIKTVREITELGLKDAKDLVDGAPKEIKKDVPKDEAAEMKKKLEAAGAKVELK